MAKPTKQDRYFEVRQALEVLVWALDDLLSSHDAGDVRSEISVNAAIDPWLDTALQQARRVLWETEGE